MKKNRPTKKEAEAAVRTLLGYIGEDINRNGLKETPARVVRSYEELFAGYKVDIKNILSKRFTDISAFDDVVFLKNINFNSLCEHHMLPFNGFVDIAYLPNNSVVGISKIARVVDAYAKRLQIQEKMTANIAQAIDNHLKPKGVAVRVSATHSCMTVRGTMKGKSVLESCYFTGVFKKEMQYRNEFWSMMRDSHN